MSPPDAQVVRRIVGGWVRKADQDIRAARALLLQDPPLLYPSCFHSQQAAEKYLKAFLTQRQVEFSKTHNIREILELVRTIDSGMADTLQHATALTPYGVEARYPGDLPDPSDVKPKKRLQWPKRWPTPSRIGSKGLADGPVGLVSHVSCPPQAAVQCYAPIIEKLESLAHVPRSCAARYRSGPTSFIRRVG
ncbi:MAG: HEPN domain-containing protein [Bacillota bacterium]|nr:HEPN domain-containing protein [Bacillota bacterium]